MKHFFTLLLFPFIAVIASAADYNEPTVVTVNGVSSEQTALINVSQNGDSYDLTLKNFVLASASGPMAVGNVSIPSIIPTIIDNTILLQVSKTITITPGDDPSIQYWMANMLPPVPVNLEGKLENGHLRCHIDIDLTTAMGQLIEVSVGKGYQFKNTGFESWHTSTGDYVEPNSWHSFESAVGDLAAFAGNHIKKSDDAHSGSASACVFSTSIFGIVANGTMTTGRLNAGSMTAADVANHAFMDISKTDVDGNGDPFYTPMYSRPDSIAAWVKFKQGTPNADNPYATFSAVITDGTYYQDPEDKEYTNVVARAKNNTIAQTDGAWVRVVAPFVYTENSTNPQAILATASTNANPGKGSGGDELLIDDIQLIYNAKLASLKVKGHDIPSFSSDKFDYEMTVSETITLDDIVATTNGKAALTYRKMEAKDDSQQFSITVYGGDMSKKTTYTITFKQEGTAITNINKDAQDNHAIYNLNGQRVTKAKKGIYITNGKKVLYK